jgi:hypothetical protein
MVPVKEFILDNVLFHLIPNDKLVSFQDYFRLFYDSQKHRMKASDIGDLVTPDLP